ncbi:MAG TPA: porin family protein, partial [Chitinophagaceae bacterium]|nr:porin family protein [Chitinophagaceae bacterium]
KIKSSTNSSTYRGDIKTGITVAILVDVPVGKNLFLQPGVNWTQKGSLNKESIGNLTYKTILTVNYIEIPLNLVYKFNGCFIGAGASVFQAMEGHQKTNENGETKKEDVPLGNKETDAMRQLDFGVNLLAGYELPAGIFLSVTFNQGLRNLSPQKFDDVTIKSTCHYFGIRLGYLIKGK